MLHPTAQSRSFFCEGDGEKRAAGGKDVQDLDSLEDGEPKTTSQRRQFECVLQKRPRDPAAPSSVDPREEELQQFGFRVRAIGTRAPRV